VRKLAQIRKDQPRLNFYLAHRNVEIYAKKLFAIGCYEKARELCERIRWIFEVNGRLMQVCRLDGLILRCFVKLKDRVNVKKSIEIMKEDFTLAFGSADIVGFDFENDILEELNDLKIDCL